MGLFRIAQNVLLGAISALSIAAQTGISIGVKGGVPLTNAFADSTFDYGIAVRVPLSNRTSEIPQTVTVYSGSRYFSLGPTVEFYFPFRLSLEADALYRPIEIRTQQTTSFLSGSALGPALSARSDAWEFPIMAKYRIFAAPLQPYFEAGPAFRVISASLAEHMSGTGISIGIGVESRVGPLRLSPEVRFTHWGADGAYNTPYHAVSHPNQVEFLVGLGAPPAMAGSSQPSRAGLWNHLSLGIKGGFPFTHAFMQDQFGRVTYPSVQCGDFSPTASCSSATPTVQTFRASRLPAL